MDSQTHQNVLTRDNPILRSKGGLTREQELVYNRCMAEAVISIERSWEINSRNDMDDLGIDVYAGTLTEYLDSVDPGTLRKMARVLFVSAAHLSRLQMSKRE